MSCMQLKLLAAIVLKVTSVRVLAVGHEVKRWSNFSCERVLHMMHSKMAGRLFFCKFSEVCNLSCSRSHKNIVILGGVAMPDVLKCGIRYTQVVEKFVSRFYCELVGWC
jgi:hypothetical protein